MRTFTELPPKAFLRVVLAVLTAASVLVVAPAAQAQAGTEEVSARVATPGLQSLTVTGTGFTPGLAIFVLPCPGVSTIGEASGDTCDTADLAAVTSDRNGAFEAQVEWFVPPEGLVFAAGDPASTNFAAGRVAVADRDPSNGECRVLDGFQGVSLSWFPVAGAVEYVYRIDYDNRVRYDRVAAGGFTTVAVEANETVSVSLSGVYPDGTYSPAQDCGTVTTTNVGASAACEVSAYDGGFFATYPEVEGATAYVWALQVNGGSIAYDRVRSDVLTVAFEIGSGATGNVRVSAVFADGTYSDNIQCASVEAR